MLGQLYENLCSFISCCVSMCMWATVYKWYTNFVFLLSQDCVQLYKFAEKLLIKTKTDEKSCIIIGNSKYIYLYRKTNAGFPPKSFRIRE